jgi:hypothetical protein
MSAARRFLLDANIFIEAHRRYYGLDVCIGFWAALIRENDAKRLASIDKVRAELVAIEDALSDWVESTAPAELFKGTADKRVIETFRDVLTWVEAQPQFTQAAKEKFANGADGWVVAYAKVNGYVVVTHEQYRPGAQNTVPIPNVCVELGVDYCNAFEMLRDLKVQFVLRHGKSKK